MGQKHAKFVTKTHCNPLICSEFLEKLPLWADLSKLLRLMNSKFSKNSRFSIKQKTHWRGKVSNTNYGNVGRLKMLPVSWLFDQGSSNGRSHLILSLKWILFSLAFFWISETLLRSCQKNKIWNSKPSKISWKNPKIANLIKFHPKFKKYKKKTPWTLLTFIINFQFLFACNFFVEFFQIRLNADVCTRNL